MPLRCPDCMKKPARKPRSNTQHSAEIPAAVRSLRETLLLWLQLCFFLSGAAGLIDEVVWTKTLGQLFGYSSYAVATVIAVFMGGLAIGSALFGRWLRARKNGIASYAWMEFGIAASALLLPGIALVRRLYFAVHPHLSDASALIGLRFFGAAIVLAIPTMLMGGTFPVLLGAITREASELGVRAGRFYAVNTIGAVAGTIAAGVFLIPWIGLRASLIAAAVLNVIAGAVAWKAIRLSTVREVVTSDPATDMSSST